jgi:hypothetical protein
VHPPEQRPVHDREKRSEIDGHIGEKKYDEGVLEVLVGQREGEASMRQDTPVQLLQRARHVRFLKRSEQQDPVGLNPGEKSWQAKILRE